MRRIGRTPPVHLPDKRWGIHARDRVHVYQRKTWIGEGKVLKVNHKTNRVWVEGINLREYPTKESVMDSDITAHVAFEVRGTTFAML